MEFIVREMTSKPGTVYVRYDCACGCKPGVEHSRESAEAGYEHCCCGNVHFVGPEARRRLEDYLSNRREEDADLGGYEVFEQQLAVPGGGAVDVAYAVPQKPRAH